MKSIVLPEFTIHNSSNVITSFCPSTNLVFLTIGPMTLRLTVESFQELANSMGNFSAELKTKGARVGCPSQIGGHFQGQHHESRPVMRMVKMPSSSSSSSSSSPNNFSNKPSN
jgi:hypothetical protein